MEKKRRKVDTDTDVDASHIKPASKNKPAKPDTKWASDVSKLPLDSDWPKEGVWSLTTPMCRHKTGAAYLSEIIMIHKHGELPPQFWQQVQYQKEYQRHVMRLHKVLETEPFSRVHRVVCKFRISGLGATFNNLLMEAKISDLEF